ncbi:poly [ADP-ribose] polymerase tankyrase-1-like 1 [Homarus americanus]|uniref:Poly [ADP-ribose] polymerase tankyrase-1-like 1 n=2 Tax=Homarus americanus TaxID=6706 RepID=A0A8J5K5P9_HOMAM|nr:poly [ADP-ribose] polymerase tankyrase-1-like 1 [Homarus americanus]
MQGGGSPGGDVEDHYVQEMLVAVQTGDEEKLRLTEATPSKAGVNHVYPHPVSATALHVATQNESVELVRVLLQAAADPNARDLQSGRKYCPIHYATNNGNIEILQALLKAGADPNAKEGEYADIPPHLGYSLKTNEDNFKACLDALLSCNKIKVDTVDSKKSSPLFMAATKSWEYMTRQMILKGANVDAAVGRKTARDVINKNLPCLLDTIDFSVIEKPQRYFSEELYDALVNHDLDLFREILDEINSSEEKSKASILEEDHGEYTLLQYACDKGLPDFVEELLKNGANPSRKDDTNNNTPILYIPEMDITR